MTSPVATEFVEMRIVDVRRGTDPMPGSYAPPAVILLEEVKGERRIGIWVGALEGWATVYYLEKLEGTRPGTWVFISNLIEATGSNVREVRISKVADNTYYAELVLGSAGKELVIDARPSDVLPLALAHNVPIRVQRVVIDAYADSAEQDRAGKPVADMEDAHSWAQAMLDRQPNWGSAAGPAKRKGRVWRAP